MPIASVIAAIAVVVVIAAVLQKPALGKPHSLGISALCAVGLWLWAICMVLVWISKATDAGGGDHELLGNIAIGVILAAVVFSIWPIAEFVSIRKIEANHKVAQP